MNVPRATGQRYVPNRPRDRRTELRLFALPPRRTATGPSDAGVAARITVRALRGGLRPASSDAMVVTELVDLAKGDVRLLAQALERVAPGDTPEAASDTGARAAALLRRALEHVRSVGHDT